jgi:hypothetical protein
MKGCLIVFVTSLLSGPGVQAAIITLDELHSTESPGVSFSVHLVGRDFADATVGGGVDLFFNPAVVQVTGVTFGSSAFDFNKTVQNIDNTNGKIDSILVASLSSDPSGDFNIATIELMAIQPGFSTLDLEPATFPAPWLTLGGIDIAPTLQDGSVTVVPLPPSLWMVLGGLGAIGFTRRRGV